MKQNLTFDAESVEVQALKYNEVSVQVKDADISSILSQLKIDDVVDYYGTSEVLQSIGADACKDEFDLTEKE